MRAERKWINFNFSLLLNLEMMNNKEPAIKKRIPAINNGGIEEIAKRIARYVDPHIIYTATKADSNFKRDPL
jgi:hypothetical protein